MGLLSAGVPGGSEPAASKRATPESTASLGSGLPKSVMSALVRRAASPAALGYGRPFNEYTWLTTHNSFSNKRDNPKLIDTAGMIENQNKGLNAQLLDGVRGFMLDVYWDRPKHSEYNDVLVCHIGTIFVPNCRGAGFNLPLREYLKIIKEFLDKNPREVVTIFLEDSVGTEDSGAPNNGKGFVGQQFTMTNIDHYIFNPSAAGADVKKNGWPSLQEMIDANKRLLVFTDASGSVDEALGITYTQNLIAENDYHHALDEHKSCNPRYKYVPLQREPNLFLGLQNHFASTSRRGKNSYEKLALLTYSFAACRTRWANYIAVDYYDEGDTLAFFDDLATLRKHGYGFTLNSSYASTPPGYEHDPVDLNAGAHGTADWAIYLITRKDKDSPLEVIHGSSDKQSCPSSHPHKLNVDLNTGAGGDFIYFCANDDSKEHTKVIHSSNPGVGCGPGWTRINLDLNRGTERRGESVHLCVR